ncbi:hypothetical protein B0O99DRAFT_125217 [Bisporella sp. PMI_857]|nr:hypothetical protein B0O99DRAFT_125217 [Bisporella sp. PMI_857]
MSDSLFPMAPATEVIMNDPQLAKVSDHFDISRAESKLKTESKVTDEGTLDINVDDPAAQLANVLKPVLDHHVGKHTSPKYKSQYIPASFTTSATAMNIVVHIVGSRGDVQPFISLGKVLKETYNHRVRIATHLIFKDFVEQSNLEFFNIGGDPEGLMAYMVKNPGLLPDLHTLASGDVGRRRETIYEIVNGCWRSCIEPGDGCGQKPDINHFPYQYNKDKPFIADAIIANPPSFAHIHCAEKLGIPLHMMFTMPWSPTQAFPHPLVNVKSTNANRDVTNYISYTLVDMMTWQGLGDIINKFRIKVLNLEPISVMWAPGLTHRLRIPFTYCWSPALIPKPEDWAEHISISGFYFLSLASGYTPDKLLLDFLAKGPPPVYIGFGSIVVDDPDAMTMLIFKAVKLAGIRALVSQGWGGLGANEIGKPDEVFMLGNIPHDWLFQHVSAVVHHGGAGTTAAGVLAGRPTIVVPFFGDQPFWGSMIARAGAGPEPIPYKKLTAELLAAQLRIALAPETLTKARELGQKIASEQGSDVGAKHFHSALDPNMQCAILPGRVAVWRLKRTNVLISAKAAAVLCMQDQIHEGDFKLHRSVEYETEDGPWDPVSGVASVLVGTLSNLAVGAADLPSEVFHTLEATAHHWSNLKHGNANEGSNVGSIPATTSTASLVSMPETSTMKGKPEVQDVLSERLNDARWAEQHNALEVPAPGITLNQTDASNTSPVNPTELERIEEAHSQLSADTIARLTQHSDSHDKTLLETRKQKAKDDLVYVAKVAISGPMDLTESIAKGFHNAPRLYNDKTVRPQEKITDLQSGLKAAGRDFAHAVYDGVAGVVTQPFNGAKEGGVAGFVTGVGKGIGGLILKPTGAVFSVPADTIKGVYKELQKTSDTRLEEHIIKSRLAQGKQETLSTSEEEKVMIVKKWAETKSSAASQPHLNKSQTLANKLSWKLHGGLAEEAKHGRRENGKEEGTGHLHGLWHPGHHHHHEKTGSAKPVAAHTTEPIKSKAAHNV